jgi:HK97 family phage major capsid protein
MEDTKTDDTGSPSQKSDFDVLAQELKSLTEAVRDAQKKATPSGEMRSDDKEKIEKMEAEVASLRKALDRSEGEKRRGAFAVDEDDYEFKDMSPTRIKSILTLPSTKDSGFSEIQRANDDLYLGMVALGLKTPWESATLRNYVKSAYPYAAKAMEIGSNSAGGSFIPTGFSRNLIELVQLDLRVAALHGRFNMPTNPYTFPVEGADITAYVVPERNGDDDAVDSSKFVGAGTPGTSNNTFTAKKVGIRSVFSGEINEDSIIPVLPYVRSKIIRSLAQAQENSVINGDVRVSSNIDGVTVATVQTTAYDGYRRACQLAGTTTDGSTFNLTNLRAVRADMGVYGVDNSQLAYVCSINGYHKFLGITEVLTVDKIGSRATILNGQMGSIDGIPIIVSEYVSNTLDSQGLNAGTASKTEVLLVRRDMFQFGDWREITLKNREVIETDQFVLVALQRLAFKSLFTASASQTFAGALVNVTP